MLKRHSSLYIARFAIVSRNCKSDENQLPTFNDCNRKEDIPPLFLEINKNISLQPQMDEYDKAIAITVYLRKHIKGGPGLGLSSDKALQLMLDGKGGVCSDHAQIFNIFCLLNDIKIREWGIVEKLCKPCYGHSINEIYSTKYQKWILIDSGKSLCFSSGEGEPPFSVIELFSQLRMGKPLHFFSVCRLGTNLKRINFTYSSQTIPFLITNYVNKDYDYYFNMFQDRLPSFAINALLILLRKNYRFLFVIDDYKSKLFH